MIFSVYVIIAEFAGIGERAREQRAGSKVGRPLLAVVCRVRKTLQELVRNAASLQPLEEQRVRASII
jgi:hypothetical protein